MTSGNGCLRSEKFYESLDPLIAPYVRILNREGIETIESCQCTEGHMTTEKARTPGGPYSWPWIRFIGGAGAGFKAVGVALECGWPVTRVYREWSVRDSAVTEESWFLEFVPFSSSRHESGVRTDDTDACPPSQGVDSRL